MHLASIVLLVFSTVGTNPTHGQDDYQLGPDSSQHEGVPAGTISQHRWTDSKVFPGTERDYWVYVPQQYDPSKPACVMVFQDGRNYARREGPWRVPNVMDNLIHRGEMPVTIAIFINPGVVPAANENSIERFNRSFEYDAMNDNYATFLVDEILPAVGREYNLSADPNDRAICGASSGAIAAFSVAWHRPDQFRRVISTIGTYVGLRGGDIFPTLVRKTEAKPIRVFLQDGSNDLNIYGGDWWMANQDMLSALQWAGYDVTHEWGTGGHNSKHGGAFLPQAMRWIWRDYPKPIEAQQSEQHELSKVLVRGEGWKKAGQSAGEISGLAVAQDGSVYFSAREAGEVWKFDVTRSESSVWLKDIKEPGSMCFDRAGNLYCGQHALRQITRVSPDGNAEIVAKDVGCAELIVLPTGIYSTDPEHSAIWFAPFDENDQCGPPSKVADMIQKPMGLTASPDQSFLCVSDAEGRYIWSFQIGRDGKLNHGQPYWYVHQPLDAMATGAGQLAADRNGWLYMATSLGVQAFDQPGRCHGIVDLPEQGARIRHLVFAGSDVNQLVVATKDNLYLRATKVPGVQPWQAPVKPPRPRL